MNMNMTEQNRDELVAIINGTHLCLLRRPRQQQQKQPRKHPQRSDVSTITSTTAAAVTKSCLDDLSTSTSTDEKMAPDDNHDDAETANGTDNSDKTTLGRGTTVVPGLSIRFVPMLLNQKEQILHCSDDNTNESSSNYCDLIHDSSDRDYNSDIFSQAFIHNNYWREFTIDNQLIDECFTRGRRDALSSNGKIHLQHPYHYNSQQQEQKDNTDVSLPLSPESFCSSVGSSNSNGMTVVHVNDDGGIYLLNTRTPHLRDKSDSSAPAVSNYGANNDCDGGHCDTFTLLLDSRHRRRSTMDEVEKESIGIYEGVEEADEINEFLRVNNENSGYIVADYFGHNALEQILFLPPIVDVDRKLNADTDLDDEIESSRVISKSEYCGNSLQQIKCTLLHILMHSILTDGKSLFCRRSQNKSCSKPWEQKRIQTFHQHNKINNKRPSPSFLASSSITPSLSSLITMPVLERKYCKDSRAQIISLPQSFIVRDNQSYMNIHDSKKRRVVGIHGEEQSKRPSNDCSTANFSPPSSPPSHELENNSHDKNGSASASAANVSTNSNNNDGILRANAETNCTDKDILVTTSETSRPSWKERIRSGLQKRLEFELQKKQRQKDIKLIKEHVLQQNRIILQKLSLIDRFHFIKSNPSTTKTTSNNNTSTKISSSSSSSSSSSNSNFYRGNTNSPMMLEMVRIRHKIHTADGMSSNSLSVKIYLEVDILLYHLGTQKSNAVEQQREAAAPDHVLEDVQLSCSFNSIYTGEEQEQMGEDNIVVKTNSGVVPYLRKGECVTIVASVHVSGIHLTNGLSTPLSFTLNAFWSHGSMPVSIRSDHDHDDKSNTCERVNTALNMKGIALGSFVIPTESLFISSPGHDENGSGITSIHETDFSKSLLPAIELEGESEAHTNTSMCSRIFPSRAIFEYRKPRVLIIDVSNDVSADIVGEWKTNMVSMNGNFVNGNYIDIYHDTERMQIKVTALAESPEHRAALVELIIKYLPENARVVGSFVEPIKESSLVESMLGSAKKEIELFEKHHSLVRAGLCPSDLSDLALAQSRTDELAARLMALGKNGDQ